MRARGEYRDREETEVAVLDALVDRDDGMSVFELRARVDADIDELEAALGELKDDDLIVAEQDGDRTVIRADERVAPDGPPEPDPSLIESIRRKLGL